MISRRGIAIILSLFGALALEGVTVSQTEKSKSMTVTFTHVPPNINVGDYPNNACVKRDEVEALGAWGTVHSEIVNFIPDANVSDFHLIFTKKSPDNSTRKERYFDDKKPSFTVVPKTGDDPEIFEYVISVDFKDGTPQRTCDPHVIIIKGTKN